MRRWVWLCAKKNLKFECRDLSFICFSWNFIPFRFLFSYSIVKIILSIQAGVWPLLPWCQASFPYHGEQNKWIRRNFWHSLEKTIYSTGQNSISCLESDRQGKDCEHRTVERHFSLKCALWVWWHRPGSWDRKMMRVKSSLCYTVTSRSAWKTEHASSTL